LLCVIVCSVAGTAEVEDRGMVGSVRCV